MILLLRALSRAVAFVLLVVLAVTCLAAAAFCLPSGDSGLAKLGELTQTTDAADQTGHFIDRMERGSASDDAAGFTALAGVVGLVLVAGAVLPRRERTLALEDGAEGRIAARRRPLQGAVAALASGPAGVTRVKARVRGRYRRAGGRARVKVGRGPGAEPVALMAQVRERVDALTGPFSLRTKVRSHRDEKGRRAR